MTGAGADAERGDEVGARPHKWEVPPSAGGESGAHDRSPGDTTPGIYRLG